MLKVIEKKVLPLSPWYIILFMSLGIIGAILGTVHTTSKMYLITGTEIAIFSLGLLLLRNHLNVLVICLLLAGVATPFLVAALAPSYYPSQARWFTSKGFWIMLGMGAIPGLIIFFLGVYLYTMLERVRKLQLPSKRWIRELNILFHVCIALLFTTFFRAGWDIYSIGVAYGGLLILLGGSLYGLCYRLQISPKWAAKGMILLGVLGFLSLGISEVFSERAISPREMWMVFSPATLSLLIGVGMIYFPRNPDS